VPNPFGREASFDVSADLSTQLVAAREVSVDFGSVRQDIRDHRVSRREIHGGVLLDDLLGGGARIERGDDRVERNPRADDANDAVVTGHEGSRVLVNRLHGE